ncbi:MAG: hypothetical protein AB7I25_11715 [Vicinamibacterales bacterium]
MSDHHAPATPDDDYTHTPPGAGYEHTDAHSWTIAKALFWLAVLAIGTHLLMYGLFKVLQWQNEDTGPLNYPLAAALGQRLPPEPRLQTSPTKDIRLMRAEEDALLSSYGWVDKANGVVRLPIEEGMRLAIERSLRARPDVQNPGTVSLEDAGAMPSDASAGRVMERRRQ